LRTIRSLYEQHAGALSDYLRMPLPAWVPEVKEKDQWRMLTKLRSETEAVSSRAADYLHKNHDH
jgi:hypothetical protein